MIDPGSVVLAMVVGAHTTKLRPSVVISTVIHQQTHGDLVLGLLTGNLSKAVGPTDYVLQDWAAAGLHKASGFRTFLFTALRQEVKAVLGKLSDRDWSEVQARLRLALAVT